MASVKAAVAVHETMQRQGPVHVVMSGGTPPPPLPPAATADRVKADLIDAAIIFGGAWLIGQMVWVSAWTSWRFPLPFGSQNTTLIPWLPLLVATLYWFTEVAGGRSPGKRIAGVRIVTAEGGKPGFVMLKKRWMIKIGVFSGTMFLCMVLWQIQMGSPMRNEPWLLNRLVFLVGAGIQAAVLLSLLGMRGLHDRVSGCAVARFDAAAATHPAWNAEGLHIKQLILKTPRLLLQFVKSASGIFDAQGKFSWKALYLYPVRMIKSKTRTFLQGAALGMIIHFSTVGLSGGYNDVAKFPTMLMVPTLSKSAPSSTLFFPVATALWGTVASMLGFIIGVMRGGSEKKRGTQPALPGAGMVAGVLAFWACEDLLADDSGLSEWGADPSRFAAEGGLNLVGQSAVVGTATGVGNALGQTAGEAVGGGLLPDEGPPGEGWVVKDGDGKEHFFPTEDAANKYWQSLTDKQRQEEKNTWIAQRQTDLKAALDMKANLEAAQRGYGNAGFDTSEHNQQIKDLDNRITELKATLAKEGAGLDYTPEKHDPIGPGKEFVEAVKTNEELKEDGRRLNDQLEREKAVVREELTKEQQRLEKESETANSELNSPIGVVEDIVTETVDDGVGLIKDGAAGIAGAVKDLRGEHGIEIVVDTVKGISKDLEEVGETAIDLAVKLGNAEIEAGKGVLEAIGDVVTHPIDIGLETAVTTIQDIGELEVKLGNAEIEAATEIYETGKDIVQHPGIYAEASLVTAMNTTTEVKDLSTKTAKVIVEHARDHEKRNAFLKNVSGYNNFANAMDPAKPLGERLAHSTVGTIKVYATIHGLAPGTVRAAAGQTIAKIGAHAAAENIEPVVEKAKEFNHVLKAMGIDTGDTKNLGRIAELYRKFNPIS